MNRKLKSIAVLAVTAAGLAGLPALSKAQEGDTQSHGTIIIRGSNGEQVIHIDGKDLNLQGDGNQVIMLRVNNNGEVSSFVGSPGDLPFGGMVGPGIGFGMMAGAAGHNLNLIDPGVTYIYQLLKRADVRSELFIDSKQREQLEQMFAEESQAAKQRVDQLQQALKSGDAATSAEDRAKKLHEMIGGTATDRDKKLAAILTAKQIKRLKELDLQYRGPLAMGVQPVAQKMKLNEQQAPAVADLLRKYHEEVRKALGVEQKVSTTNGPDGTRTSVSVSSQVSGNADELKAKFEKAQEAIEQARRTLGDQALKGVGQEQRSEWKAFTGTRFQFRNLN